MTVNRMENSGYFIKCQFSLYLYRVLNIHHSIFPSFIRALLYYIILYYNREMKLFISPCDRKYFRKGGLYNIIITRVYTRHYRIFFKANIQEFF